MFGFFFLGVYLAISIGNLIRGNNGGLDTTPLLPISRHSHLLSLENNVIDKDELDIIGGIMNPKSNHHKNDKKKHMVYLKKGSIDTRSKQQFSIDQLLKQHQDLHFSEKLFTTNNENNLQHHHQMKQQVYQQLGHYLVQLDIDVNEQITKKLETWLEAGNEKSTIIDYMHVDTYHVFMTAEQAKELQTIDWVAWVGVYDSHYKIHIDFKRLNQINDIIQNKKIKPSSPTSLPNVMIQLVGVTNDKEMNELIQQWTVQLDRLLYRFNGRLTKLEKVSNNRLESEIKCLESTSCQILECEQIAYEWIANQHQCQWIERLEKHVSANFFAPSLMFSGTNSSYPQNDLANIPLRGQGQVMSCADTGIDLSHCFFNDPNNPTPGPTHRKVILYDIESGDGIDEVNGHGTHVAGSMAGSMDGITAGIPQYAEISKYQGTAYQAKLAFADISTNGSEPKPKDYGSMYQKMYDAGSRVHGDSWGSNSVAGYDGSYGQPAADLDTFIFTHEDFLIVRAAGNWGDYGSILTQGNAKNVLTVGAHQSTFNSTSLVYNDMYDYTPSALAAIDSFCLFDIQYCNTTSADCCANSGSVRGLKACCIPLLKATILSELSQTAYNENNMAGFSSKGPTHDGRIKPDVVGPGEFIISSRSNGDSTSNQCAGTVNEALLPQQGTSMATPQVAGAATVLRQYLTEGYYPSGTATPKHQLKPSASLLKSLIINSAEFLNGTFIPTATGASSPLPQPLTPTSHPFKGSSYVQGWGAVKLGNSMKFPSTRATLEKTWLGIGGTQDLDDFSGFKEPSITHSKSYSFCVKYTSNGSPPDQQRIKATLVWTDPPPAKGALYDLVNNLDLQLRVENEVTFGNGAVESIRINGSLADSINNVEQIEKTELRDGFVYKYTVFGTRVPVGPQKYSFVVRGEGGNFDWSFCPQCTAGEINLCTVPNGIGSQSCGSDLLWKACIVDSCSSGYNYNSITNSCFKVLSYNYIVMIVAGGTMVLLFVIIGTIKYLEYRENKRSDDKDNNDGTGMRIKHKPKDAKVTVPDLYKLLSPFILRLLISAACSLIATAASILQPFYIGNIIQKIPTTTSINQLREDFIYIFLLALVEFIFTTISSWISGIVNELMIKSVQTKIFKSIMAQDMGFFHKNNTPTLMNVLIVDAPMLRSALTGILLTFATGVCKFVGSLTFLFLISWKLSLAFFGTVPVLAIVTQIQSKFSKRLTRTLLFYNSKAAQHGSESMVNMQVVTNYCRQEKEIGKYEAHLLDVFITARKLIINNTLAGSVKWFMVEALAFIILYFGAYLAIKKEFSVGLLVSFSLYVGYVVDSSQSLFGIYLSYVQSLASAHRVFMILRSAPRKRTTLEEERADQLEKEDEAKHRQSINAAADQTPTTPNALGASEPTSDSKPSSSSPTPPVVGEDPTNNNNNNSTNTDKDSSLPLTAKQAKKMKKLEEKNRYKQTGIDVIEMNLIPQKFVDLQECKGEIEFRDVSFTYPTRPNVQVLHNISFKLESGKCYGLVGPSGSGKSTILELMSKFYQLKDNNGKILLDGTDITKIRPSNLRSFVTVVHQQPFLFDATIAQNIGYALENPTQEEILEASQLANAHEFIQELPAQYETQLGQAGSMLSGGQKKRIAVARAICAKRKIMLLDEITAELDPHSEELISNSIKKLTQGHTVVMVAHKVAAVRDCDRIFVLEKGHLVEEGTHTELMEKHGRYYRLFSNTEDADPMELPLVDVNNNNN